MNTAVTITVVITRTVLDLALIAAGLMAFRLIAGRVQVAPPKAPQVRVRLEPETIPAEPSTSTQDPNARNAA